MIDLHDNGKLTEERGLLEYSLGNISKTINVLKDITTADVVDLLFYDNEKKHLYDKIKHYSLPIRFLEDGSVSMIAKAYQSKTTYHSLHTLYDKNYNTSLDNPYKITISAQIIMPIIKDDIIIGMARFSKHKYTYDNVVLKRLLLLHESLIDIFLPETYDIVEEIHRQLFSIEKREVYDILDRFYAEVEMLLKHSLDPEIRKLLQRTEESLDSIYQYIKPIKFKELEKNISVDKGIKKSNEPVTIRVLIADDILINVKVLKSMISAEDSYEIFFALDGIETIEKIEKLSEDGKDIHILFLDHHMPGKLGLEIAQYIRSKEELNQKDKMVIVSITNDPEAIGNNAQLYDYHIPKPFIKSHVIDVIERVKEKLSI